VTTLSDAELVKMSQNGDIWGLGTLLERHRASLNALALGFLGRGPDAQDAVQDAFVLALCKIGQLKEPEAAGGWLRSIVRHVCLDRLRERRGKVVLSEPMGVRVLGEPRDSSAGEIVDRLATREWVWTALSELPEALRVTAMLRYFGTYPSYGEISAILGVPLGTVKSRLNKVKRKLAEALLKTAGQSHDEARLISDTQTHFFTEAYREFNRGSYEMFADAFSRDLVLGYADGGLEFLVHRVWEENLESGVKLHPTSVLASKEVTVIEADFENPRDDPFHCPPATSIVCFYRDGKVRFLHQYYEPRPAHEQR
jgi:RNA polymerase sigma factor (sigma-70 family)